MKTQLENLFEIVKISEFTYKEEKEFYKFLKNSPDVNAYAFENNWPYILQATRNGQYKFYFKSSVVYFTLRYEKCSKKNFVVIVNFLGKNRKQAVLEFCKILKDNKIDVLIKNIDKKELPFWKKQGFIESKEPWSKYSFRDDNTFPLHIISSDIIETRNFNSDYRRLFKKFDKESIITGPYNPSYNSVAKNLLKESATFLFNKGVDEKEEVVRAHSFFFNQDNGNPVKLQHVKNNKLVGFSSMTLVKDVAFGNVLVCIKRKDLMKYLAYSCMKYIAENYSKVKYFSIQGSENKGQDFFKYRYNPTFSIEKIHIVPK